MKRRARVLGALLVGLCCTIASCQRGDEHASPSPAPSAAGQGLPPLELRDDTAQLLLTWVDEKGDFHVVQKIADVPEAGRESVRVVVADREAGTGEQVYVADLRTKRPDGTYPVKTLSRSQWDEIGASRRKARLEALTGLPDAGPAAPPPAPGGSAAGNPGGATKTGAVVAVIYGANWCKPCHDAARHLRQRGVTVIEKNVEESDAARAELKQKLERAQLPATASIPIIDVMGRILIGYSPASLDRAVEAVRATQTL